jgi:2'-5' RNA ligase
MKSYTDIMMILSPPENIAAKIEDYKHQAANSIGNYESMHSRAHISVKNLFQQKLFLTGPAIDVLEEKLAAMPPVILTIDGFDYFNHGIEFKTIYAKIRMEPATTLWFKALKKYLNVKEHLTPHITIARNIPVDLFNELWPQYQDVKWVESFTADSLTLLHRESFATFDKWEVFKVLPFKNKNFVFTDKHKDLPTDNAVQDEQISLF